MIKPSLPRKKIGQASDFQLQTLAPQKISRSTRIKFVARSLLISGRGKSSLAPRILIIRPPKYVPLGSLAFYILRGTCYISTREEGYRWQCLWRADVTKCTEAPRRLPNCVAIAETSHSSWRCTLHGILPALPFFFLGRGGREGGLLRFVVAIERVWKVGGYFWRRSIFAGCFCRWGVDYKKEREGNWRNFSGRDLKF